MANRRWLGKAKNVRQKDTITVALVWGTSDTVTITINGQDLVITIGANTTTAQVATTIKEAINGSTLTDTTASASPSIADGGGQGIAEFLEISASIDSATPSVVDIEGGQTGNADKPFTMTVTESTAGTGTATEATVGRRSRRACAHSAHGGRPRVHLDCAASGPVIAAGHPPRGHLPCLSSRPRSGAPARARCSR